jgi:hypothetical protein
MFYFITIWLFLGIASGAIGLGILKGLQVEHFLRKGDRSIVSLWLGLIAIGLTLLAVSFWVPLSPLVGWGLIVGMVLLSLWRTTVWTELVLEVKTCSAIVLLGLGIVAIAVALFTTQQVTWIDTGLYHYGLIRWLRQFGTVPGMVLLNGQFGFVSTWFAVAAPLNPALWEGKVSAVTNGFVLLLVICQLFVCFYQGVSKQRQLSDWFMVAFILLTLPFSLVTRLLSLVWISPSPDAPLIFLVGVTAWSWLVLSDPSLLKRSQLEPEIAASAPSSQARSRLELIPVILSAGAIATKLIALPVLPISLLFYVGLGQWSLKRGLIGVATIIILLLPLLAGGIITSGCPLYPSTFLCLNLPWSETIANVQSVAEATHGWGTWFGTPPAGANPLVWRLEQWFHSIGASKLIVALLGVSTLSIAYLLTTLRKNNTAPDSTPSHSNHSSTSDSLSVDFRAKLGIFCVGLLAILGSLFAVLKAPILRFGISYFVLIPALTIAIVIHNHLRTRSMPLNRFFGELTQRSVKQAGTNYRILLSLALATVTSISVFLLRQDVRSRLLLPPVMPQTAIVQRTIHDVPYFEPQNSRGMCWSADLPCAAKPHPDIYLLKPAKGIAAGFARRSH